MSMLFPEDPGKSLEQVPGQREASVLSALWKEYTENLHRKERSDPHAHPWTLPEYSRVLSRSHTVSWHQDHFTAFPGLSLTLFPVPHLFLVQSLENIGPPCVDCFSLLLLARSTYPFPSPGFTELIIILAASLLLEVTLISIFHIPHAQNRSLLSSDFIFSRLFGTEHVCVCVC